MFRFYLKIIFLLMGITVVHAAEFRDLRPIPTPVKALSQTEEEIKDLPPVSEEAIKTGLKSLLASWNTSRMEKLLASEFYDRDRLLDAMQTFPDRGAKLRILAIKDVQILGQRVLPVDKEHVTRVSTVSVNALTQIEFEDPVKGLVKLEGENEYLLRIREHIRLYP